MKLSEAIKVGGALIDPETKAYWWSREDGAPFYGTHAEMGELPKKADPLSTAIVGRAGTVAKAVRAVYLKERAPGDPAELLVKAWPFLIEPPPPAAIAKCDVISKGHETLRATWLDFLSDLIDNHAWGRHAVIELLEAHSL